MRDSDWNSSDTAQIVSHGQIAASMPAIDINIHQTSQSNVTMWHKSSIIIHAHITSRSLFGEVVSSPPAYIFTSTLISPLKEFLAIMHIMWHISCMAKSAIYEMFGKIILCCKPSNNCCNSTRKKLQLQSCQIND